MNIQESRSAPRPDSSSVSDNLLATATLGCVLLIVVLLGLAMITVWMRPPGGHTAAVANHHVTATR